MRTEDILMKAKVFVPMSDGALEVNGELYKQLVPFDPMFLSAGCKSSKGRKPSNWIVESNCEQAKARLVDAT